MTIYQLEDIDVILKRLEDGEGAEIGVAVATGNRIAFDAMLKYENLLRQPEEPLEVFRFMMAYARWRDTLICT